VTDGWRQPASRPTCAHWGLIAAQLSVYRHEVGHEWVCKCGKVFVVAERYDGIEATKRLVPR